jgi:hypothetical protein
MSFTAFASLEPNTQQLIDGFGEFGALVKCVRGPEILSQAFWKESRQATIPVPLGL